MRFPFRTSMIAISLILVGAGCAPAPTASTPSTPPPPSAQIEADGRVHGTGYSVLVDPSWKVKKDGDTYVLIQNYVSKDGPSYTYPPNTFPSDAFELEIFSDVVHDVDSFKSQYQSCTDTMIDGRAAVTCEGRNDTYSWPGTGILVSGDDAMMINMKSETPGNDGSVLAARAVLSLRWE